MGSWTSPDGTPERCLLLLAAELWGLGGALSARAEEVYGSVFWKSERPAPAGQAWGGAVSGSPGHLRTLHSTPYLRPQSALFPQQRGTLPIIKYNPPVSIWGN